MRLLAPTCSAGCSFVMGVKRDEENGWLQVYMTHIQPAGNEGALGEGSNLAEKLSDRVVFQGINLPRSSIRVFGAHTHYRRGYTDSGFALLYGIIVEDDIYFLYQRSLPVFDGGVCTFTPGNDGRHIMKASSLLSQATKTAPT